MAKSPISGFPEWLPAGRIVEQRMIDKLRQTFELHGFSGIETRAVEPVERLLSKGETSKEIYLLRRLQDGAGADSELGLHFDLTVPLSRYVLENAGHWTFRSGATKSRRSGVASVKMAVSVSSCKPTSRWSMGTLLSPEWLPLVMVDALSKLPIPRVKILASNRKVAQGFYEAIGLEDVEEALRILISSIGRSQAITEMLADGVGANDQQARLALELAGIRADDASVADRGPRSRLPFGSAFDEVWSELVALVEGPTILFRFGYGGSEDCARSGLLHWIGIRVGARRPRILAPCARVGITTRSSLVARSRIRASDCRSAMSRILARVIGHELLTPSRKVPTCVSLGGS